MPYAADTGVPAFRSQEQIRDMLRRRGADEFGVYESASRIVVAFRFEGLSVRVAAPCPISNEDRFTKDARGRVRKDSVAIDHWQQEVRRIWRCLLLMLKAKLEAVETGITTLEKEFLPYVMVSDSQDVYDVMQPLLSNGRLTAGAVRRALPSAKDA